MKTIELTENKTYKQYAALLVLLYRKTLKKDSQFHFFFEPRLIIRTQYPEKVVKELKRLKVKYRMYDYPYPRKGYGESKEWKTIQPLLEKIFHLQAVCALTANQEQSKFISNRLHHGFLNMVGKDYYEEAAYYLRQAKGYMGHQYKTDEKWSTLFAQKLIAFVSMIIC